MHTEFVQIRDITRISIVEAPAPPPPDNVGFLGTNLETSIVKQPASLRETEAVRLRPVIGTSIFNQAYRVPTFDGTHTYVTIRTSGLTVPEVETTHAATQGAAAWVWIWLGAMLYAALLLYNVSVHGTKSVTPIQLAGIIGLTGMAMVLIRRPLDTLFLARFIRVWIFLVYGAAFAGFGWQPNSTLRLFLVLGYLVFAPGVSPRWTWLYWTFYVGSYLLFWILDRGTAESFALMTSLATCGVFVANWQWRATAKAAIRTKTYEDLEVEFQTRRDTANAAIGEVLSRTLSSTVNFNLGAGQLIVRAPPALIIIATLRAPEITSAADWRRTVDRLDILVRTHDVLQRLYVGVTHYAVMYLCDAGVTPSPAQIEFVLETLGTAVPAHCLFVAFGEVSYVALASHRITIAAFGRPIHDALQASSSGLAEAQARAGAGAGAGPPV